MIKSTSGFAEICLDVSNVTDTYEVGCFLPELLLQMIRAAGVIRSRTANSSLICAKLHLGSRGGGEVFIVSASVNLKNLAKGLYAVLEPKFLKSI